MKVIGIDPGKKSAVAVIEDDSVMVDTWNALAPYQILRHYDLQDVDIAVIENAYVGANSRSSLSVARNIGRWQEALESRGIKTALVLASEWQSEILGVSGRVPREDRKRLAQLAAGAIFGLELDEHSADALLIAQYGRVAFARREI